jgi:hypothetical protein
VIRQDVKILKVQGEQIRKHGVTLLSTPADVLGTHIRGLRRQAAEGLAPTVDGGEVTSEVLLRI